MFGRKAPGWLAQASSEHRAANIGNEKTVAPPPRNEPEPQDGAVRLRLAKERAVREAYGELELRRQEFHDAAIVEHQADSEAYTFDCKRHGDFLTVFTGRLGREGTLVNFSTTIHLMRVREVRLELGRAPGVEVGVEWWFLYSHPQELNYVSFGELPPRTALGEGETVTARSDVHPATPGRPSYRDAPRDKMHPYGYFGRESETHGTMPRPAKDDQIQFVGLGSALLVPFGHGQKVLDRILSEMAKHSTGNAA
jgi:hypothetical protein